MYSSTKVAVAASTCFILEGSAELNTSKNFPKDSSPEKAVSFAIVDNFSTSTYPSFIKPVIASPIAPTDFLTSFNCSAAFL